MTKRVKPREFTWLQVHLGCVGRKGDRRHLSAEVTWLEGAGRHRPQAARGSLCLHRRAGSPGPLPLPEAREAQASMFPRDSPLDCCPLPQDAFLRGGAGHTRKVPSAHREGVRAVDPGLISPSSPSGVARTSRGVCPPLGPGSSGLRARGPAHCWRPPAQAPGSDAGVPSVNTQGGTTGPRAHDLRSTSKKSGPSLCLPRQSGHDGRSWASPAGMDRAGCPRASLTAWMG